MTSFVLFLLRLVVGGLLVGHGGQKLFGWFGGHGLDGTTGWMASMRLKPPRQWAMAAGGSELGGGLLMVLGLLNPIGPLMAAGAMLTAWAKVHWGKPIWVTQGGAELPLTNLAILGTIALRGPGRLSLDAALRIRTPWWLVLLTSAGIVAGVAVAAQPELLEGATPLGETGAQIEGDPAMDADDRRELELAADVYESPLDGGPIESPVDVAAARRGEA